ncbi:MAG: GxxExxY protein [Verrucomicrobiota bacterium]
MDTEVKNKELTGAVINAALTVHKALGPGLLESVYEKCLAFELSEQGYSIEKQKDIPLTYRGLHLESGFRADLIVENQVLVELKAVESLQPVHQAQVITYLKLSKISTALLINFNVPLLKNGIKRISL